MFLMACAVLGMLLATSAGSVSDCLMRNNPSLMSCINPSMSLEIPVDIPLRCMPYSFHYRKVMLPVISGP
jgi:hypothetical protein